MMVGASVCLTKFGRIEKFVVQHDTLREQMGKFDFSGKVIKQLHSEYTPEIGICFGTPQDRMLFYYDRVFVEFTDGDVVGIQGFDGDEYDDIFFVDINNSCQEMPKTEYDEPSLAWNAMEKPSRASYSPKKPRKPVSHHCYRFSVRRPYGPLVRAIL